MYSASCQELANDKRKSLRLEVVTNGMYDQATATFVGDYFDTVVLSIDGLPDIHNLLRPRPNGLPSHESVVGTAAILSQSQCDLVFRCCITDGNVEAMPEITAWLCEDFSPSAIHFEPIQVTSESSAAHISPAAPYVFARRFWDSWKLGHSLGVDIRFSGGMPGSGEGFCPARNDGLIVSPDGRISSCYALQLDWKKRGLDLDLGFIRDGEVKCRPRSDPSSSRSYIFSASL